MKHIWIISFIVLLTGGASYGQEEKHFFTDTQGRAIEATITACDFSRNQVTLERAEDQRRVTVPINMFCQDDQAYIKEWYMANELISDKNLKIECKQKTFDRRKEERTSDVTGTTSGGYIGTRSDVKKYEKIGYEITLQNRGAIPLDKMRIEYRIYYEQSEKAINPEPLQKVFKEQADVPALDKGKKETVTTASVEIYKEELSHDANIIMTYTPVGGRGEVHGIRGRLYLTLPSGKVAMREFCEPSSLSEQRFPWQ